MPRSISVPLALAGLLFLAGCAGKPAQRQDLSCAQALEQAYAELDFAKAQGFSGTVSWTKAASLLAAAKVQEQVEQYEGCIAKADKARFYIKQSQRR